MVTYRSYIKRRIMFMVVEGLATKIMGLDSSEETGNTFKIEDRSEAEG